MGTGGSPADGVWRLWTALHAKAKETLDLQFHSLADKVWRTDIRNGGGAGIDGETFKSIEEAGVDRWIGELARDPEEGTCRPKPVRRVPVPKKQRGKFRLLGLPCIRDRVARTAAMLALSPIFEADLQPEQCACRPDRGTLDSVKQTHRALNIGRRNVVDADLADCFGQIPHAELMKSVSRRAGNGRMLGWIKAWLPVPVEEDDGDGGRRLADRVKKEGKDTPQGAPASSLLDNIYMRRFLPGWKKHGFDQRFDSEIVNYADNFVVLGKASPEAMLEAAGRIMVVLKLPAGEKKTRCLRVHGEPLAFFGCRIGRNYRSKTGLACIGTRPHKKSVQSICHAISDPALRRSGLIDGRDHGGGRQPPDGGLGQLLRPRPSQLDLCVGGQARNRAATPQAQGRKQKLRAVPGQAPARAIWTRLPCEANGQLSAGEGTISSESRMREIRTSGLTSGGVETRLLRGLKPRRTAKSAGNGCSPRRQRGVFAHVHASAARTSQPRLVLAAFPSYGSEAVREVAGAVRQKAGEGAGEVQRDLGAAVAARHDGSEGAVAAADAMHTQRTAAETVVCKGGDFVMALKGNQKTTRKDAEDWMEDPETAKEMLSHQELGYGRGCIETRTAAVSCGIGWLQDLRSKWR